MIDFLKSKPGQLDCIIDEAPPLSAYEILLTHIQALHHLLLQLFITITMALIWWIQSCQDVATAIPGMIVNQDSCLIIYWHLCVLTDVKLVGL
mgnify:FL=1